MQLVYLYIREYKNIQDQGFHFSSKYRFTLGDIIDGLLLIKIEKNDNHIDDFFENKKIHEVTAIIGENGSGKSTLVEFVKDVLSNPAFEKSHEFLAVYESLEGSLHSWDMLKSDSGIKVTISGSVGLKSDAQKLLEDQALIYYSNNFDLKFNSKLFETTIVGSYELLGQGNLVNISTIATLSNDLNNIGRGRNEDYSELDFFKAEELNRNIKFFMYLRQQGNTSLIPFEIPKFFTFQISTIIEGRLNKKAGREKILNMLEGSKKLFNPTMTPRKELCYNQFLKAIILDIIIIDDYAEMISSRGSFEGYFSSHEYLLQFTKSSIDWLGTNFSKFKAKKYINLIEKFEEGLNDPLIFEIPPESRGKTVGIVLGEHQNDYITSFYDNYLILDSVSNFLNFQWRSLSSGEQSFLTLLSRFYSVINNEKLKSNVTVLIDEGDLYFHPEWQRKYLKLFIDNIPSILGEQRKYQFIFTGNSPFLAADLPTDKVIFLKSGSVKAKEGLKTFASNIHTLLSDGFFLTSFLGEFAQDKIEKIAKRLMDFESENKISEKEREQLRKTIEAVGEPIIKARLTQLFEDRFNTTLSEDLDSRERELIVELRKIQELKKSRNDKN